MSYRKGNIGSISFPTDQGNVVLVDSFNKSHSTSARGAGLSEDTHAAKSLLRLGMHSSRVLRGIWILDCSTSFNWVGIRLRFLGSPGLRVWDGSTWLPTLETGRVPLLVFLASNFILSSSIHAWRALRLPISRSASGYSKGVIFGALSMGSSGISRGSPKAWALAQVMASIGIGSLGGGSM